MNYIIHLLVLLSLYVCILLSTNLMVGMTNLFTLAQGAFLGIGAYLGVWLLKTNQVPFIPAVIIVGLLTGLSSLIISIPSIKLKGDYYILATIGFQFIVIIFLNNSVSITRGPLGIAGIPQPNLFPTSANSHLYSGLIIGLLVASVAIVVTYLTIYSPFGRLLKGIRENETAVLTLGRDPVYNKILVCMISSALMGVAGLFYAGYISYIDPSVFNLDMSIFIISALLIGGSGNLKGPIVGALFIVLLPEGLRMVGLPSSQAANIRQIIYGISLILVMRLRPQGIAGENRF